MSDKPNLIAIALMAIVDTIVFTLVMFAVFAVVGAIASKVDAEPTPVPLIQPEFQYGQVVLVHSGFYKGLEGRVVDVIEALDPPIKTPVKKYKIVFLTKDAPEPEFIRPELMELILTPDPEVNNSILPEISK